VTRLWLIFLCKFKSFFKFALISGIGWLLDMMTFVFIVFSGNLTHYWANFISSYVGVTFVYFVSLKSIFNAKSKNTKYFLFVYWAFQFLSIVFYSALIKSTSDYMLQHLELPLSSEQLGFSAKIIITPINLLTNFVFMKYLVTFMHREINND
jgi:putative flippase GtrA